MPLKEKSFSPSNCVPRCTSRSLPTKGRAQEMRRPVLNSARSGSLLFVAQFAYFAHAPR